MPVLLDYIEDECGGDIVVVAPDAGRVKVAERYSQHLGADLAFVHKRHIKGKADEVEARGVIGDVGGRRCVIIDDRIDTGGTIVRRGRHPQGARRHRGVGDGDPRRARRSRHRPLEELGDRPRS